MVDIKLVEEANELERVMLPSMVDTCLDIIDEMTEEYYILSIEKNFNNIYYYSPFPGHQEANRFIEVMLLLNNVDCRIGKINNLFCINLFINI